MCLPCPQSVCVCVWRGVGWGGEDLKLYSNRALPLFVLAMTIILRCLQETKTGYSPCFCCYVHFGGKLKADCKCLDRSPPISCLRKHKQEASCKCLTWSPSISYFKGTHLFSVLVSGLISFYDNKPQSRLCSSFP